MEKFEKEEIQAKATQISELLGGDTDSKFRALEIAESIKDERLQKRFLGQVLSKLTLDLEEEGTEEALATSANLKKQYFNIDHQNSEEKSIE